MSPLSPEAYFKLPCHILTFFISISLPVRKHQSLWAVSWKPEFPLREAPRRNTGWPEPPYLLLFPSSTFQCQNWQVDSICPNVFLWSCTSHVPPPAVTGRGQLCLASSLGPCCQGPPGWSACPSLNPLHHPFQPGDTEKLPN